MKKKIVGIGVITAIIIGVIGVYSQNPDPEFEPEPKTDLESNTQSKMVTRIEISDNVDADIIMPTKVSRPGCEITDSCYVPSEITIDQGGEVTWSNDDSAFHSVTSGSYGDPTGLFDSGYMDPGQKFTVLFDEKGNFDFYCTLHPWMKGRVIVQ